MPAYSEIGSILENIRPMITLFHHSSLRNEGGKVLLNAHCRNAALYQQSGPFLSFLFWFSLELFMIHIYQRINIPLSCTCSLILSHNFYITPSCHFFPPQHQGVAIAEQCYCCISPCEGNRQLLHCHSQGLCQHLSHLGQYYGNSCSKYQNSDLL